MTHPIQRKAAEPEDEGWLITFADMSVLLMSFFIILFAVSVPDEKRMQEISKSLRESGFYYTDEIHLDPAENLKKELSLALAKGGFEAFVAVQEVPDGVTIELSSGALFPSGSAQFMPSGIPLLETIAAKLTPLAQQDIHLEIEGHTDDAPIATPQFPSNWELSAARAANVVRYLIAKEFPPTKLRVIGLADTVPKAPNLDAAGNPLPANQNLNRRVVVHLKRGADN